jgi:hypothetical protein
MYLQRQSHLNRHNVRRRGLHHVFRNGDSQQTVVVDRANHRVVNALGKLNLALEGAVLALGAVPLAVGVVELRAPHVLAQHSQQTVLKLNLSKNVKWS